MSADFGDRLRSFRKYRSLTLAELGQPLGKSATTISDWERNRARPTLEQIEKLAELLECSPHRLAFGNARYSESPQKASEHQVSEFLQEYGGKSVDKGAPPSHPRVIFDPSWNPEKSKLRTSVTEVLDHLRPWLQAAADDPDVPPVMMHLLRKHLPHEDIPGVDPDEVRAVQREKEQEDSAE